MEDDIIKRKLLIDGDGVGDDRRINILLKSFLKWSATLPSTQATAGESNAGQMEEDDFNFEKLKGLVSNCKNAMQKSILVQKTNQDEIEYYQLLRNQIQNQIEQMQQQILSLKQRLQDVQQEKRHKLEYNDLCNVIEAQPERKLSQNMLIKVEGDLQRLQQLTVKLNALMEERRQQFERLVDRADSLLDAVKDDRLDQLYNEFISIVDEDALILPSLPEPMDEDEVPVLSKDTYPNLSSS